MTIMAAHSRRVVLCTALTAGLVVATRSAAPASSFGVPVVVIDSTPPSITVLPRAVFTYWSSVPSSVVKDVLYGIADDGTPLKLDEYWPSGPGPWHGVLVIHGGGWKAGTRGVVQPEAMKLVAAGFAAFAVDYRLAPGNNGDDHWPAQIDDLRTAMTFVRALPNISGVGALGVSAGAHLAQYLGVTGVKGGTRADVVASLSGPSKLSILNPNNPNYEVAVTNLLGCSLLDCPDTWNDASPYFHVDADTSPMYLGLTLIDPLVYIDQIRLMEAKLIETGIDYRSREVAGGGHVSPVEEKQWNGMLSFLWGHLGPTPQDTTYECGLDGAPPVPCNDNIVRYLDLLPGTHTFSVQGTNGEGQGEAVTASWATAPTVAFIQIGSSTFDPQVVTVRQGAGVQWIYGGMGNHTVTDNSGMSIYHSGYVFPLKWEPGQPVYGVPYFASGTYPYVCTILPTMGGTIQVPLIATPTSGHLDTVFTMEWSSIDAPEGVDFDVQIRRPGSDQWEDWAVDQTTRSGTFTPDTGLGTYGFRARMEITGKPKAAQFSLPTYIEVVP